MTLVLPQENRARFSRDLDESISSSSTAVANSNSSDSEDQVISPLLDADSTAD
jgi:hypothetical protein